MTEPTITHKTLADYQEDPRNANQGNPRGLGVIEDSLNYSGVGRSLVADKHGVLIAGNKTSNAAVNAGIEHVIEIETDGDALIVHKRRDLDLSKDARAKALAIADNRASEVGMVWEDETLAELLTEIKHEDATLLRAAGFYENELQALLAGIAQDETANSEYDIPLTRYDVPDALFASNNEYDIPVLEVALQAATLNLPAVGYGSIALQTRGITTYHFYTDDRRFEPLWNDPTPVINSGCRAIIEPNFSCYPTTPRALVLWNVYRKRWLARYYQSHGIRVIVDLNVAPNHAQDNLLGVPYGWKSYACAARADDTELLFERYQLACAHAGTTDDLLFVVYGTGKHTKTLCQDNGWVFLQEFGKAQWIKSDG